MFSLASIFQGVLLLLNALAILSEKRFLIRYGLASATVEVQSTSTPLVFDQTFGGGMNGFGSAQSSANQPLSPVKQQVSQLLASVRMLLRWPLIFLNCATIVFALIFG